VNALPVARKDAPLEAEIRGEDEVSVGFLMGEDKAVTAIGKKEAVYLAVGAFQDVIGLVQLNGPPALGAFLYDGKHHSRPQRMDD